jgi:hypothetical protein
MKHQVIAGAGLAAVIAFCGYMISQLDARRTDVPGTLTVATSAQRP